MCWSKFFFLAERDSATDAFSRRERLVTNSIQRGINASHVSKLKSDVAVPPLPVSERDQSFAPVEISVTHHFVRGVRPYPRVKVRKPIRCDSRRIDSLQRNKGE